jgi:hypothetical protein
MQPTIQLADLSRSFAAEVFERRAMVGTIVWSGGANTVGIIEIRCKAVGGIVIESLSVEDAAPPFAGTAGSPGFHIAITEAPLPLFNPLFPVAATNIGGSSVKSTMRRGDGPQGAWYGLNPVAFISPNWQLQPTTIWVRPGSYLTLGSANFNTTAALAAASVNLIWREIPEIQGAVG